MKKVFIGLLFLVVPLHASDFEANLINGAPADLKDWPASVRASSGEGRCSATVVGPRALLIASHCVNNGGIVSFTVGATKYNGRCTHAPGYPQDSTADWTMCLVDTVVTGINYENLNTDPGRFKTGDKLTLTGYGCVNEGGGGGNDGVLRIGQSTISSVPSQRSNDIITRGGAALCFGDSGGAAYYVDSRDNRRFIVGVNSRGDIQTTSYMPSVSESEAQDFFKSWAQRNDQTICGVTTTTGCR